VATEVTTVVAFSLVIQIISVNFCCCCC